MNFIKTEIEGVTIIEPKVFSDKRGYFFESYNEQVFAQAGICCKFVQDNQSSSCKNTLRGLHCQLGKSAQAKLVRVLEGTVLDVAVDFRKSSPTFGKYVAVELSGENKRQIFIPRGFLHGFSVLSEHAEFFYKCDNFWDKSSEFGVRYDDKDIAIDWKINPADAIISDKDKLLGDFKDAINYGF